MGARSVSSYLNGGPIGDEETLAAIAQVIGSDWETVRKGPWPALTAPPSPDVAARCAEHLGELRKAVQGVLAILDAIEGEDSPGEAGGSVAGGHR